MSEHERRVNDKNIKAYEQMDVSTVESGVQKLGSHYQNIQRRYLMNNPGAAEALQIRKGNIERGGSGARSGLGTYENITPLETHPESNYE